MRAFRIWDYRVSHDQLLLRSAKIKGYNENIDIIFYGVNYIQLSPELSGLTIQKMVPPFAAPYESVVQNLEFEGNNLFEIVSGRDVYLVAAAYVRVFENNLEFDESSLGQTEQGKGLEIGSIS